MVRVRVLVEPRQQGRTPYITYSRSREIMGELKLESGAPYPPNDVWDLASEYPLAYVEVECFEDKVNGPTIQTPEPPAGVVEGLIDSERESTNEWKLAGDISSARNRLWWHRFTHGNPDKLCFILYVAGTIGLSNQAWRSTLRTSGRKDGGNPNGSPERSGDTLITLVFTRMLLNPFPNAPNPALMTQDLRTIVRGLRDRVARLEN